MQINTFITRIAANLTRKQYRNAQPNSKKYILNYYNSHNFLKERIRLLKKKKNNKSNYYFYEILFTPSYTCTDVNAKYLRICKEI